jgi:hypothetical protein
MENTLRGKGQGRSRYGFGDERDIDPKCSSFPHPAASSNVGSGIRATDRVDS